MIAWWNNLDIIGQIFALVAIPSTLILLVQTVMLIFGFGDDEADVDADDAFDSPANTGDGLVLFSIRGIVGMLCVGGWSGLVMNEAGLPAPVSIIIAVILGIAALFGMAYLMKAMMKLQSNGNINLGNAIGKTGKVYIPIPPNTTGSGKITIIVQEKLIEVDAVTTASRRLNTGESVRVVATDEMGVTVVEPIIKDKDTAQNT